jgi:hypothetical protein
MSPLHSPIRETPPSRRELHELYPSSFTWEQLRILIKAGDLRLLRRHKDLQARLVLSCAIRFPFLLIFIRRYERWTKEAKAFYGSLGEFLLAKSIDAHLALARM